MASATTKTLTVTPGEKPKRLDLYLAHHADLSRTKLQEQIKAGRITINGKKMKAHHLVRAGDVIELTDEDINVYAQAKKPNVIEPIIIFEDENYLVVNKPSGLVVHGGPGIHELTLADWALARAPQVADVGDQPHLRPGIVHRLDRDVSGVMIIAKTQAAFDDLKKQFQHHRINKVYIALAHGRLSDPSGRISFAIARKADKSGLMVARPKSQEGKAAETLFTVIRFVKYMTLVRVQTLTGRTHQIRVHFKAIGHPLVGDPLYKARKLKKAKTEAPRLFLHAAFLGFTDLKGVARQYEAPLPEDLQRFLGNPN